MFKKKVITVDTILAPFTDLIASLTAHSATKQGEVTAAADEIARQETLKADAQLESDRALTIAQNLKNALVVG